MKLPGRYKGKRKHKEPPAIVRIECPGCGWKSRAGKYEDMEPSYVRHLLDVHYGALYCVFCPVPFPDFKTLAEHVKNVHPQKKTTDQHGLQQHTDMGLSAKKHQQGQLWSGLVLFLLLFLSMGQRTLLHVTDAQDAAGYTAHAAPALNTWDSDLTSWAPVRSHGKEFCLAAKRKVTL